MSERNISALPKAKIVFREIANQGALENKISLTPQPLRVTDAIGAAISRSLADEDMDGDHLQLDCARGSEALT